jgi:hypothetical protein
VNGDGREGVSFQPSSGGQLSAVVDSASGVNNRNVRPRAARLVRESLDACSRRRSDCARSRNGMRRWCRTSTERPRTIAARSSLRATSLFCAQWHLDAGGWLRQSPSMCRSRTNEQRLGECRHGAIPADVASSVGTTKDLRGPRKLVWFTDISRPAEPVSSGPKCGPPRASVLVRARIS